MREMLLCRKEGEVVLLLLLRGGVVAVVVEGKDVSVWGWGVVG